MAFSPDTIPSVPRAVRDAYALHQAFAKLGFALDDVYVGVSVIPGHGNKPFLYVKLDTQGKKYTLIVEKYPRHREAKLGSDWLGLIEWGKNASDELLGRFLAPSKYMRVDFFVHLADELLKAGFEIPWMPEDVQDDLDFLKAELGIVPPLRYRPEDMPN